MTERLFMSVSALVSVAFGAIGIAAAAPIASAIGALFAGLTAVGTVALALQGVFAAGWGYVAFRRRTR